MLSVEYLKTRSELTCVYINDEVLRGLVCPDLDVTVISSDYFHLLYPLPARRVHNLGCLGAGLARISISGEPTRFMRHVYVDALQGIDVLVGSDLLSVSLRFNISSISDAKCITLKRATG
jgi:hypothetical protein